ncbi:M50 family metallopeptidase [Gordoniibacillus kamchatkensis]|uniref:M50 family metallopeptidase n=1 Tax=Gordoniibacillus kamchatkensis TaxID=1590651 RepID=UPI000A81AD44|nr:M50 family metallopeptidase [Paenibacillus sp. VKM B-2647]
MYRKLQAISPSALAQRLIGAPIRLHPLFVVLLVLSVVTGYFLETATLFVIVFIHELGHAAAARGLGWRIRHIRLLPFGGVAEVEEHGNVPAREELLVALAGPLQHVWMIAFAWLMKQLGVADPVWWEYFIKANMAIGLFNLLPIMPLDGGRVLQCLVCYGTPYRRAMSICTYAGLALSALLVALAALRIAAGDLQLNLLLVGLFLLSSNWMLLRNAPYQFLRFLMSRDAAAARFIGRGTLAQPIVVSRQRRLADIVKLLMRDKYHLIYVLGEGGTIQAVMPEQRIVERYLRERPPGSAVSELFVLK